jgi:hypothetical protein
VVQPPHLPLPVCGHRPVEPHLAALHRTADEAHFGVFHLVAVCNSSEQLRLHHPSTP